MKQTTLTPLAAALFLTALMGIAALSGCSTAPPLPSSAETSQSLPPEVSSLPDASVPPEPETHRFPAVPAISPKEAAALKTYDFSQPAPESPAVELDYFDDAAFVGDSRTDGFLIYSGIGRGKNLTSNGLSIFKLDTKKALTINKKKYTLLEALALGEYGKVYFSLGINELGYFDDEGFYQGYLHAVDAIREAQPNAVIYIQGLIPINEAQVSRPYFTNERVRNYNDIMRRVAEEKQVVFLDLYSAFADENGELPAQASKDGVHLYSQWCRDWLTYLQTHTVDYDTLYPALEN